MSSEKRPFSFSDLVSYFINFIRTGNPNGEELPDWPANTGAEDRVLVMDTEIQIDKDPFAGLYPILDEEI